MHCFILYLLYCRLYACEFNALFELDRTLHWGECFDVASSLSDSTSPVDTTGATTGTTPARNTNTTERTTRYNTHSSSLTHNELPSTRDHTRTTPTTATTHSMSYEVDRDDGEGGEIPEDDDMYILPIKLTSCRVLIPQVNWSIKYLKLL